MSFTGATLLIIIAANTIVSYKGFNDQAFFDRYKFHVDKILIKKEYWRLITSSFLHIGWTHLILNVFSLLIFSGGIEEYLGEARFLIIYFASMIGGDLFALLIHRNHGDYNAVGASGAVCGIIFSAIALFPGMGVGIFLLPVTMPGWLYGLLYVLYSIYGIKSKRDNVGHEAHLGGAVIGMLVALIMKPSAFAENYFAVLMIIVPVIIFIGITAINPSVLLLDNFFHHAKDDYSIDHKYNAERNYRRKEIDRILDKINKHGIGSLSLQERMILEEYSKKI